MQTEVKWEGQARFKEDALIVAWEDATPDKADRTFGFPSAFKITVYDTLNYDANGKDVADAGEATHVVHEIQLIKSAEGSITPHDRYAQSDGEIGLNVQIDPLDLMRPYAHTPIWSGADTAVPYELTRLCRVPMFLNFVRNEEMAWENAEGGYPVYRPAPIVTFEMTGFNPLESFEDAKIYDRVSEVVCNLVNYYFKERGDDDCRPVFTLLRPYICEWYLGYR
jgi:hypothetical protein